MVRMYRCVIGCCCKEIHTYIDFLIILLIPTPLVLALYCSSIPTSLFIFYVFSFFTYVCTRVLSRNI